MNKYQEALNKLYRSSIDEFLGLDECENIGIIKNNEDIDETYWYKTLQEFIDKHEKFKWHDLRKDPNDLPKIEWEQYLVDTGNSRHYYCVATFVDGKFATYDNEWDDLIELDVKRWKYIEDFKDE